MEPDAEATLQAIERLRHARIGEYSVWKKMIKKLECGAPLDAGEREYYTRITRIYKKPGARRGRPYHVKLSDLDAKPPCKACGAESAYYCNMNDDYFCQAHLAGHDINEP